MELKRTGKGVLFAGLIFALLLVCNAAVSKDLNASLAQIPGLAETPDKGAFVDLVKEMGKVYKDGKIIIEVYPFARSINNIIEGKADFHIPCLENPAIDQSKLPYRFVTEKMGSVSFAIYSEAGKPITKKMIDEAVGKGGKFPYKIEVPRGTGDNFNFPNLPSDDVSQSLQKVSLKRIDAYVVAHDEGDAVLKSLKLKTIHRELWGDFIDGIIIQKGPKGDETDKILSDLLRKLKASGKLKEMHEKLHLPYDDWQPAKMGW
jgi:polar amino acid transport system substrate-binding protein